jgi:hypothetical protein
MSFGNGKVATIKNNNISNIISEVRAWVKENSLN